MTESKIKKFPKSRIATNDICAIGIQKHHIAGIFEIDVSTARERIKLLKKEGKDLSFTAWMVKVISDTIKEYEDVAGYLKGKRNVIIFEDVNVSMIVEKDLNGHKVPIPLVIEKANARSIESITIQISQSKAQSLTDKDIVLQGRSNRLERFYYYLPGFLRRSVWRYLLKNPKLAYSKMGNVAITSVGMVGDVNGWFIPISVHPICFGLSNIGKKPVVVNDKIEIREMLHMSVLIDHDVVDGMQMARFIGSLSENIKKGSGL